MCSNANTKKDKPVHFSVFVKEKSVGCQPVAKKAANIFEKKMQPNKDSFELLQLDMIISSIEAKWVDNE